jgi:hypothetical protein
MSKFSQSYSTIVTDTITTISDTITNRLFIIGHILKTANDETKWNSSEICQLT